MKGREEGREEGKEGEGGREVKGSEGGGKERGGRKMESNTLGLTFAAGTTETQ